MKRLLLILSLCIPVAAQTITLPVPLGVASGANYPWQLIPNQTVRIQPMVTGGATNSLTWAITGTTGGASATLSVAASPNLAGAYVDVTVGATGGTCSIIGAAATPPTIGYSATSTAFVTLTATSIDNPAISASIPIDVCASNPQTYISPFNVTLYKTQCENFQSTVWGSVNKNVTWSISSGPAGMDATLNSSVGGVATRDATFCAGTVSGRYILNATSVATPASVATVYVYVGTQSMPSYALTPNFTEPVDCEVDPAISGTTYDIGAGKTYATIAAAFVAIGSNTTPSGTTFRLFNTDTTGLAPTRFPEYVRFLGNVASAANPIRICGVPDSLGNLPIIDGHNATAYSPTDNSVAATIVGGYQIGMHTSGVFGVYPNVNGPAYIIVEGLAFRNAYSIIGGVSQFYFAPGAGTHTQWGANPSNAPACIRPYEGQNLTVRGNDIQDCAFGSLADFNGNNGWGGLFSDVTWQGNYFNNLGTDNSACSGCLNSVHMLYTQGYRQLIQGNIFDKLKSVSAGGLIKSRGVDDVIRYNVLNNSTQTRMIDMVEQQDANMFMFLPGWLYASGNSGGETGSYYTVEGPPRGIAIGNGGTGYVVGDVVTLVQGGGSGGTLRVTGISGGVVTSAVWATSGTGYHTASGVTTSGGSGSSLTINLSYVGAIDAYTPSLIAAGYEAWHHELVYGNTINQPSTPSTQGIIHFFGDQSGYSDANTYPPARVGQLGVYSNTVNFPGGNFSLSFIDTEQNSDGRARSEWPQLLDWNNAIYAGPSFNTAAGHDFLWSTLRSDFTTFGNNWISSTWGTNNQTCTNNTGNACVGTGWPWFTETTSPLDGANLPAHISGFSSNIIGGTSQPFNATTLVPTTGGGLVSAGATLPTQISNMPVRYQKSPSSYLLTPRTSPLTIGAQDQSGSTPTAGVPTFSPGAGTYSSTQAVTISTTSGGVICYNTTGSPATNGTTGCTTGTIYTSPVSVATSETLFAVAGGTGFLDSTIGSASYVITTVTPVSIALTPSPITLLISGAQTMVCTTTLSNSTTRNCISPSLSSTNMTSATVSGLVVTATTTPGTGNIGATAESLTAQNVPFTVTSPSPSSLMVGGTVIISGSVKW